VRTRVALGAALLGLAAFSAEDFAAAYCPCYTASSNANEYGCAIEAQDGDNPDTASWNAIFDVVSKGPSAWGDAGPTVDDVGQGCGKPEALHSVPARFPCELLKGIAMQESGWRQFCVPDTPADQAGGNSRTIISFDCGYGIGQVTSGMHNGETPDFDRERVAGDPTYNLATGTRILADKWKATDCVGDNQPTIIEDWYSAAWAYNGLAYVNNPNNPNYDPNRGVWNPQVGGGAPYQEKVFGWIEFPDGQWDPTALAYPNPGDIGGSGSPGELPEPSCASPTDCTGTRMVHATACGGAVGAGGGGGGVTDGAGVGGGGLMGPSGAGAGGEGTHAASADDAGDDGGCGCRATGSAASHVGWAALLISILASSARMRLRRAAERTAGAPAPARPRGKAGRAR